MPRLSTKLRLRWRRFKSRWHQRLVSLSGLRRFERWSANDDFLTDQWWAAYNAGDWENANRIRKQMNDCREKYLKG